MPDDTLTIKGVNDGLLITLSTTEKWERITSDLAARIDEKLDFFKGAKVTIDTGERPVPKYELTSLRALLERRQMLLAVVVSESQTTLASATALDIRTRSNQVQIRADEAGLEDAPIDPEEQGTIGVMIRRTLRSGRTVHSRGHVVVYGDVNAGAKIIAAGDIIVWGKLRGMAHAGAEGDTTAVVCALEMSPNQLRIGDHITTAPPDKRRTNRPEMACVKEDRIVVEAWG